MSQPSTPTRRGSSLAITFACAALDPVVVVLDAGDVDDVITVTPAGRGGDPRDEEAHVGAY